MLSVTSLDGPFSNFAPSSGYHVLLPARALKTILKPVDHTSSATDQKDDQGCGKHCLFPLENAVEVDPSDPDGNDFVVYPSISHALLDILVCTRDGGHLKQKSEIEITGPGSSILRSGVISQPFEAEDIVNLGSPGLPPTSSVIMSTAVLWGGSTAAENTSGHPRIHATRVAPTNEIPLGRSLPDDVGEFRSFAKDVIVKKIAPRFDGPLPLEQPVTSEGQADRFYLRHRPCKCLALFLRDVIRYLILDRCLRHRRPASDLIRSGRPFGASIPWLKDALFPELIDHLQPIMEDIKPIFGSVLEELRSELVDEVAKVKTYAMGAMKFVPAGRLHPKATGDLAIYTQVAAVRIFANRYLPIERDPTKRFALSITEWRREEVLESWKRGVSARDAGVIPISPTSKCPLIHQNDPDLKDVVEPVWFCGRTCEVELGPQCLHDCGHPTISRVHMAVVALKGGNFCVLDCGASAGTALLVPDLATGTSIRVSLASHCPIILRNHDVLALAGSSRLLQFDIDESEVIAQLEETLASAVKDSQRKEAAFGLISEDASERVTFFNLSRDATRMDIYEILSLLQGVRGAENEVKNITIPRRDTFGEGDDAGSMSEKISDGRCVIEFTSVNIAKKVVGAVQIRSTLHRGRQIRADFHRQKKVKRDRNEPLDPVFERKPREVREKEAKLALQKNENTEEDVRDESAKRSRYGDRDNQVDHPRRSSDDHHFREGRRDDQQGRDRWPPTRSDSMRWQRSRSPEQQRRRD